ncbi:MAG: hypothetical protein ACREDS_13680, partial [Limisphaerales bacterium]
GPSYAKHVEGRVTQNDTTLYGAYFLIQSLRVQEDGQQAKPLYTALFFPRIAHPRRTYNFIIAPKTGLILDFQEISATTSNTQ